MFEEESEIGGIKRVRQALSRHCKGIMLEDSCGCTFSDRIDAHPATQALGWLFVARNPRMTLFFAPTEAFSTLSKPTGRHWNVFSI